MNNCLACKNDFEGRSNQKFCSVKCKNSFHNVKNKEKKININKINRILHKNWVVLNKLFNIYRSSPVSLEIAKAHGFENKYQTHIYVNPRGENYYMVYDIGFKKNLNNEIQIVQVDD